MDLEQLHLTAPVARAAVALGWTGDDPRVRDAVPTVVRGHNLAVVAPPGPAYGGPVLAGLVSRMVEHPGRSALVLCPEAELDGWAALVGTLVEGTPLRLEAPRGAARATRRLRAGAADLVVTTPDIVTALAARGALKGEMLGAIVLAGPDRWASLEPLVALMQDAPHDCQRVILGSTREQVADLVERYARKALTLGAESFHPVADAVRTVSSGWGRRPQAVAGLVEVLDPRSLGIWTADRSQHGAIAAALPAGDQSIRIVTGDAPEAEVVVAFDPPDSPRLTQLLAAGEVVLLVPPGTEPYVERMVTNRRPLRLPGLLETSAGEAATRRAAIVRAIEAGRPDRALFTLAPLLDRYDPTAVAAALYELWVDAGAPAAAAASEPAAGAADVPATARMFVGVGRSDGATANDLVGVLTREIKVPRERIGRIEIRDGYSLVELPGADVERIAAALNGATIRRKRVVARVDRGRARPATRSRGRAGAEPSRRT